MTNWARPISDYEAGDSEAHKIKWHRDAMKVLRTVAKMAGLRQGEFDVRSNKAGPAVSGEVMLHSEGCYMQVSSDMARSGLGILIRTCKGRKDYSGGGNEWLDIRLMDMPDELAANVRAVHERGLSTSR